MKPQVKTPLTLKIRNISVDIAITPQPIWTKQILKKVVSKTSMYLQIQKARVRYNRNMMITAWMKISSLTQKSHDVEAKYSLAVPL